MRQQKIIRTTLGELIGTLTDEVLPIIPDPGVAYVVVSWMLNDVLTRHGLRDHEQLRGKYLS